MAEKKTVKKTAKKKPRKASEAKPAKPKAKVTSLYEDDPNDLPDLWQCQRQCYHSNRGRGYMPGEVDRFDPDDPILKHFKKVPKAAIQQALDRAAAKKIEPLVVGMPRFGIPPR